MKRIGTPSALLAVLLVLMWCFILSTTASAQTKKSGKATAVLTEHPVKTMLTVGNETLFFFLAPDSTLYMTDDKDIYADFSDYLKAFRIEGRRITVTGRFIEPTFTKDQFKALKDEVGRKLGMKTDDVSFARIFSYAKDGDDDLVIDWAVAELKKEGYKIVKNDATNNAMPKTGTQTSGQTPQGTTTDPSGVVRRGKKIGQ